MKHLLLTGLLMGLLLTGCSKRNRLERLANQSEQSEQVPTTSAAVYSTASPNGTVLTHTVKSGDSYVSIARLYDISVADLLTWNKLTYKTPLQVGQQLVVDLNVNQAPTAVHTPSRSTPAPASVPTRSTNAASLGTHTVQPGETLFGISQLYDVRVEDLRQLNGLKSDAIKVGQTLKIK